ncbi:MAG: trypsin-like peptidase domain-containing protein [Patescibacteria group bacterium]
MKKYSFLPIILAVSCILIISLGILAPEQIITIAANVKQIVVPEEEAVISAYEQTLPSVVSILLTEKVTDSLGVTNNQDTGGGTGFLVSSNGYIITNKHVVHRNDVNYTVITSTGKEYAGSVLAIDPLFDLAIVKIEGSGFTPVKLGNSDKIRIGQTVLAIGNVLSEFRNTVTRGIISGVGRSLTASGGGITETIEGAVQTDASINPGNSGGPLVNLKGEVIGINTAINRSGEALGFAIPINKAKQAFEIFLKQGKIVRTFLGVRYIMLDRVFAQKFHLPYDQGAYIIIKNDNNEPGIVPDGPADKVELKSEDIILEINGKKLSVTYTLAAAVSEFKPQDKVELKILRKGVELVIPITLGERTVN